MPLKLRQVLSSKLLKPQEHGKWVGNVWHQDPNYVPANKNYGNVDNLSMGAIMKKYNMDGIRFINGYPDFSKCSIMTLKIPDNVLKKADIRKQILSGNKDREKLHD